MKEIPILVDACCICGGYMIVNGEKGMYALSRYYSPLMICPGCGVRESMEGWFWEEYQDQVIDRANIWK